MAEAALAVEASAAAEADDAKYKNLDSLFINIKLKSTCKKEIKWC